MALPPPRAGDVLSLEGLDATTLSVLAVKPDASDRHTRYFPAASMTPVGSATSECINVGMLLALVARVSAKRADALDAAARLASVRAYFADLVRRLPTVAPATDVQEDVDALRVFAALSASVVPGVTFTEFLCWYALVRACCEPMTTPHGNVGLAYAPVFATVSRACSPNAALVWTDGGLVSCVALRDFATADEVVTLRTRGLSDVLLCAALAAPPRACECVTCVRITRSAAVTPVTRRALTRALEKVRDAFSPAALAAANHDIDTTPGARASEHMLNTFFLVAARHVAVLQAAAALRAARTAGVEERALPALTFTAPDMPLMVIALLASFVARADAAAVRYQVDAVCVLASRPGRALLDDLFMAQGALVTERAVAAALLTRAYYQARS